MEMAEKTRSQKKLEKKTNRRELTNNERVLLTLLAMVIIFWLSFKFIIDPQLAEISRLESEKIAYNAQIDENNRILKNKEAILEQKNALFIEKVSIERDFFTTLNQPQIVYILNELLLNSDIEMDSISFSQPFMELLKEQEIQKMDISMPFKGSFLSLNEIIKSLEMERRKIVINNIDIQKGEETEIVGTINLGVYSLTGLVEGIDEPLPIETTDDNILNPFIPYEGYVDPNKVVEEPEVLPEEEASGGDTAGVPGETPSQPAENQPIDETLYKTYKAVKGDNISYISMREYGTVQYVDEILSLNNMVRSSILPIGKVLKLKKR